MIPVLVFLEKPTISEPIQIKEFLFRPPTSEARGDHRGPVRRGAAAAPGEREAAEASEPEQPVGEERPRWKSQGRWAIFVFFSPCGFVPESIAKGSLGEVTLLLYIPYKCFRDTCRLVCVC